LVFFYELSVLLDFLLHLSLDLHAPKGPEKSRVKDTRNARKSQGSIGGFRSQASAGHESPALARICYRLPIEPVHPRLPAVP